jgi:hypothetical protein
MRAEFLQTMNMIMPWADLCATTEPFCPRGVDGRLVDRRLAWGACGASTSFSTSRSTWPTLRARRSMIANVHAAIQHVKAAADQLPKLERRATLMAYICQRIVGHIALPTRGVPRYGSGFPSFE